MPDGFVVRRTPDGWRVAGDAAAGPAGGDQLPPDGAVLPDLLSAMVLAELLAGDVPPPRKPAGMENRAPGDGAPGNGGPGDGVRAGGGTLAVCAHSGGRGEDSGTHGSGDTEIARLKTTIAQLEHALATRVRIEQAIGVLAERHRLAPKQAFHLLRKVARSGGQRVHDLAGDVVASAANPLLLLPAELARTPPPGRPHRHIPRR